MKVKNNMPGARQMAAATLTAIAMMLTASIASCTSIDCPLNNSVMARFVLKGEVDTLKDTLTVRAIRANGTDTIVYNRGVNLTFFTVPLSFVQETDRLAFLFKSKEGTEWKDTVYLSKTDRPHFESVECGPNYFHTLTGVSSTKRYIEDIVINHSNVDYDATKEHLYLYLRPHD